MNESSELTARPHSSSTPDTSSCKLTSIIPNLGMSSCRGRAEAFARSLSSKLRTLGSQTDDDCTAEVEVDQPIINGDTSIPDVVDEVDGAVGVSKVVNNTWMCRDTDFEQKLNVTDRQPLRHDTESFFDFDCDLESPGSPADECEYLRLIETASNTPHNSVGESGYACTSTPSSTSSNDGPYYDIVNTEELLTKTTDYNQLNGTLTNKNELERDLEEQQNDTIEISTSSQVEKQEQEENNYNVEQESVENAENTKLEVTEKLLNGHLAKEDVTLSNVKLENELTKNTTITANNNNKNIANNNEKAKQEIENTTSIEQLIKSEIVDIIKAELVDISTETEAIKTTNAITVTETIKLEEKEIEEEKLEKRKDNFSHSGLDTTDDEDECRPQRVRRCSSLKTGKTPPGTPGRKKIVRFADKLGLDLADIKTFLDEIPNIPKSAFEDLEINEQEIPLQLGPKANKLLVPLFQQPGGLPTFLDLVRERQVSLENAAVTDHINQTITGSVRVRNLDFHKSVHIRYTLDHWRSYADLQANYVENSCDGFSDKFTFILFGNSMQVGQRLELAVRFQCKGQQFWDNNYGINYCFQCLPTNNNINLITTTTITAATAATTTTTIPTTLNHNRINLQNHHNNNNNNQNNNNKNHNFNNNNLLQQSMGTQAANNHIGKSVNGHDQERAESQVLRFLSPTAGEAWCGSFY